MYSSGRSTIATVGTICANKAVGISVDINPFEPHLLAANLAHSIGHNLGLTHDPSDLGRGMSSVSGLGMSDGCSCSDWHGCIMRASVIGEEGIQPYKFSTCSKNQFLRWMKRSPGTAQCLLNKPNQVTLYTAGLLWG